MPHLSSTLAKWHIAAFAKGKEGVHTQLSPHNASLRSAQDRWVSSRRSSPHRCRGWSVRPASNGESQRSEPQDPILNRHSRFRPPPVGGKNLCREHCETVSWDKRRTGHRHLSLCAKSKLKSSASHSQAYHIKACVVLPSCFIEQTRWGGATAICNTTGIVKRSCV
jgi:hypothetical protein